MNIFKFLKNIPAKIRLVTNNILIVLVILLLVFGGGLKSGYSLAENHYVAIIAKMEKDKANLEKEKAQLELDKAEIQIMLNSKVETVREKIVTKYVDKIKTITEKEYVYIEQAKEVVPTKCELSSGFVYLHDQAARNQDADSTRSSDATSSGIKDNQALEVIAANYATANRNAEQLTLLQEYIRTVQKIVDEANEEIRKRNK